MGLCADEGFYSFVVLFQVVETLQTWGATLLVLAALDISFALPVSALALACFLGSNVLLPLCPPPMAKTIIEHRYEGRRLSRG